MGGSIVNVEATLTLELLMQNPPCGESITAVKRFLRTNKVSEISFEEILTLCKTNGKRAWTIWTYNNKATFAELKGYVISQEEADKDKADLDLLLNGIPTDECRYNNNNYPSLLHAQIAETTYNYETLKQAKIYAVVNLEVFNDDNTTTWTPINIDTAIEPTEGTWCYQVFDHLSGSHIKVETLEKAKLLHNELSIKEAEFKKVPIYRINIHPDYPDDPILVAV